MSKPHNIFISWSGVRSKFVAESLNEWLPTVLQTAKPWVSSQAIDKGSRSLSEMNKALGMGFGVTCLTPENLSAPWILYEAGALSKTFDDDKSRLWTYLIGGLEYQDVAQPLGQFQHTKAEKEDTRKLIHSINSAINPEEGRLKETQVDSIFDALWPALEKKIMALPEPEEKVKAKRDSNEILTEILEYCRRYLPQIESSDSGTSLSAPIVAREFYSFKFKRHPALRDIAGSELTEPILPLNVQSRRLFHIKLANDDEVKQILGTRAVEPIAGSLFILDGDDVVGRFTEGVERWW